MPNQIFEWAKIEPRTVIAGFHGRFVHSATMTFALWDIDAGSLLPEHSHHHEQVVHLYEGEFELTVEGQPILATPGTVFAIRPTPGIPDGHSAHAASWTCSVPCGKITATAPGQRSSATQPRKPDDRCHRRPASLAVFQRALQGAEYQAVHLGMDISARSSTAVLANGIDFSR